MRSSLNAKRERTHLHGSHAPNGQTPQRKARSKSDLASLRKVAPRNAFGVDCRQYLGAALFCVTGGARACGHCLLVLLRTSSQSQSSDQQGHNHHHFCKFQFISPPFAASCSACVGKGSHRSNVFLHLNGCIGAQIYSLLTRNRQVGIPDYSSMTTGVPSSTNSNKSITSAFRIRTHPWLAGVPILSSCFVP